MSKLKKALEKAKEARGMDNRNLIQEIKPSPEPPADNVMAASDQCYELDICYTETKIKKIDNHILKKGKVISLFHDVEKVDQIKTLRTQILNRLVQSGGNALLVTSANPCEGKTFTAINLGVSIAQELDRTVLIVDADLRRHSGNHKSFAKDFFGTDMNQGLSDYLLGDLEIPDLLVNPGINRLVLLPSGRPLPNSSELLGSPRMKILVNDIKDRYSKERIVIFDSSSLLNSADPLVLSHYADGIILVVEEERTSTEELKKALELLKDRPLFGTVMNKSKSGVN